jgi:membrane fusion protein
MGVTRSRESAAARSATKVGLFRPESLEARQMVWLGRPTVSFGFPVALTSVASVLMVIATAALVAFGNYAQRIELHGVVLPAAGLIEVSSPAAGWIESTHVHDGQVVTSGETLYVVNTDTSTRNGNTQQQILRALAAQRSVLIYQIARRFKLCNEQNAELRRRIENLQAQVAQMDTEIAMKTEFVRIVTQNYADVSRYMKHGMSTLNEKLAQQQTWMRARDELEGLKGSSLRLRAQLSDTQYQLKMNNLQADSDIGTMRSKISELDQQVANSETRHSVEIRAPGAGRVTAIASYPGQMIATGARMVTIIPSDNKMRAELLAPSTSIGFIRPGERVLLRYSAFPYQKFGEYEGTVTEVSQAALGPEELRSLVPAMPPSSRSNTFYRVIVTPDRQDVMAYNQSKPLQASMQVDASVLLDERPIYQWILEPLYDLRGF